MRKTVAVDASFLMALLDKGSRAAIPHGTESIRRLIDSLSAENAKVIIPIPVLAGVLNRAAEAGPAYLEQINKCACFQVRPFDEKAAIELSELLGTNPSGKDLLQFDRQIVAIARVYGVSVLYANDESIAGFAGKCGLRTVRFEDLN